MARSATKNVVFVSHSSRDRKIVDAFVEGFLCKKVLNQKKVQYTSAEKPDSPALLNPGASVWMQLRDNLEKTCCFIACLSDDYFKSNWCIAEIAVYHEFMRTGKPKKTPLIFLVIDPACEGLKDSPFVQGRLLSFVWDRQSIKRMTTALKKDKVLRRDADVPDKNSLAEFIASLGSSYHSFLSSSDPPDQKFNLVVKRLLVDRKQTEKGFLTDLAQEHFSHFRTSNGPLTSIVQRAEYEQISVNMAHHAKWKLLWTLFKSPLLVADAYRTKDRLMPYDRSFGGFQPIRKVRLVIFDNPKLAKAYFELDVHHHKQRVSEKGIKVPGLTKKLLRERRESFEKSTTSNGGVLYFTVLNRLKNCFPGKAKPTFKKTDSLEFAYSDFDEAQRTCLLMESGFNSEFSVKYGDGKHEKASQQFRHVTFYSDPGRECSEAIESWRPYRVLLGHLDNLRVIAGALFSTTEPDPKVFVTPGNIRTLYSAKP